MLRGSTYVCTLFFLFFLFRGCRGAEARRLSGIRLRDISISVHGLSASTEIDGQRNGAQNNTRV